MRNENFDPDNITSLPDPGFEVRDHLSEVAIAILSAKVNLSSCGYGEILVQYDQILRDLHDAYDQVGPFETFEKH